MNTDIENGEIHGTMMKTDLPAEVLNSLEYVGVEHDGELKEREKTYVQEGDDEEPTEDFTWVSTLRSNNPQSLENYTYFCLINDTRKVMRKDSQAWNCYGNRTNVFLLVNYGFCFQNNLYDSVKLQMRLDIDFSRNDYPDVNSMLAEKNHKLAKA